MILYVNECIFRLQMTITKHTYFEYFDAIQTYFTDLARNNTSYYLDEIIQNGPMCQIAETVPHSTALHTCTTCISKTTNSCVFYLSQV